MEMLSARGGERLFPLGKIVATPGAMELMAGHPEDAFDVLGRHQRGDFGDICEEDARENERSIKHGFRVLSSYPLGEDGERVWLLTEADRSSTCLLLPSEY